MKRNVPARKIDPLQTLAILLIAGMVGFVGWYVWHARQQADIDLAVTGYSTNNTSKKKVQFTQKTVAPEGSAQYELLKYTISVPTDWTSEIQSATQGDGGPAISTTTITSPSGTQLVIDQNYGGKGGDCQSGASDKPFAVTNACPTLQELAIKPTSQKVFNDKGEKVPLQVVDNKYSIGAITEYTVCLEADTNSAFTLKLDNPRMGFLVSTPFVSIYNSEGIFNYPLTRPTQITACARSNSSSFLTSDDAQTVRDILASFKFVE